MLCWLIQTFTCMWNMSVSALRWFNVIVHAVIKFSSLDTCCAQSGYHMLGFHFQLNSVYYNCTALQKLILWPTWIEIYWPIHDKTCSLNTRKLYYKYYKCRNNSKCCVWMVCGLIYENCTVWCLSILFITLAQCRKKKEQHRGIHA